MENIKVSPIFQLILVVLALATAILQYDGCEQSNLKHEIEQLHRLNRMASDSILLLNDQINFLDSLHRQSSLKVQDLSRALEAREQRIKHHESCFSDIAKAVEKANDEILEPPAKPSDSARPGTNPVKAARLIPK